VEVKADTKNINWNPKFKYNYKSKYKIQQEGRAEGNPWLNSDDQKTNRRKSWGQSLAKNEQPQK